MNKEYLDYLEDIIDAMLKAEAMLEDVTYAQFEVDYRINYAVVRILEIIGEATKRLPQEFRQNYTDIPWKGMAGMRDRIIHAYDTIDLEIVWGVVKTDIPKYEPRLQQIITEIEKEK